MFVFSSFISVIFIWFSCLLYFCFCSCSYWYHISNKTKIALPENYNSIMHTHFWVSRCTHSSRGNKHIFKRSSVFYGSVTTAEVEVIAKSTKIFMFSIKLVQQKYCIFSWKKGITRTIFSGLWKCEKRTVFIKKNSDYLSKNIFLIRSLYRDEQNSLSKCDYHILLAFEIFLMREQSFISLNMHIFLYIIYKEIIG